MRRNSSNWGFEHDFNGKNTFAVSPRRIVRLTAKVLEKHYVRLHQIYQSGDDE